MEAAQQIRSAVAQVSALRSEFNGEPRLRAAVREVKRFQARRFAGTYADLLAGGPYAAAARFFLEELYGDKDYDERDAQFARIAGAIERLFPADVALTAVSLAQLHALTEQLDHAMASAWKDGQALADSPRYTLSWRAVERRPDRVAQLRTVLAVGQEMIRLTRLPGLRLMLKMMRGPAKAAGLSALQHFLEAGFDTFAAMARRPGGAEAFLRTIEEREGALISMLFDDELVACETRLAAILGQAR
jgi:hypothetical protein